MALYKVTANGRDRGGSRDRQVTQMTMFALISAEHPLPLLVHLKFPICATFAGIHAKGVAPRPWSDRRVHGVHGGPHAYERTARVKVGC